MSKEQFTIDIPEGYEIDLENTSLTAGTGKIKFKKKDSRPMSWRDLGGVVGYFLGSDSVIHTTMEISTKEDNRNVFPSKEEAQASLALAQLCQLRNAWNDGWKPKFNDGSKKYVICQTALGVFDVWVSNDIPYPFMFEKKETAELFLETFKDLLGQAKSLM